MIYDLVLLHPPTVSVFEMYPIGLTSIGDYLERFGLKGKIVNIANRMLLDPNFDVEKKIRNIKTKAFGIDLHWLPHAHGSVELAKIIKNIHR
jgi:hypothetical protein